MHAASNALPVTDADVFTILLLVVLQKMPRDPYPTESLEIPGRR